MEASEAERIRQFQSYLSERSIPAPVRYSRGQDISGGCGQLATKRKDELNLDPRVISRFRRQEAKNRVLLTNDKRVSGIVYYIYSGRNDYMIVARGIGAQFKINSR